MKLEKIIEWLANRQRTTELDDSDRLLVHRDGRKDAEWCRPSLLHGGLNIGHVYEDFLSSPEYLGPNYPFNGNQPIQLQNYTIKAGKPLLVIAFAGATGFRWSGSDNIGFRMQLRNVDTAAILGDAFGAYWQGSPDTGAPFYDKITVGGTGFLTYFDGNPVADTVTFGLAVRCIGNINGEGDLYTGGIVAIQ